MFINTKISSFISPEAIAFEASFTNEKLIVINLPLSFLVTLYRTWRNPEGP